MKNIKRKIAKERIIVEHTITRTKKFNVMDNRFRNRRRYFDDASDIASAL